MNNVFEQRDTRHETRYLKHAFRYISIYETRLLRIFPSAFVQNKPRHFNYKLDYLLTFPGKRILCCAIPFFLKFRTTCCTFYLLFTTMLRCNYASMTESTIRVQIYLASSTRTHTVPRLPSSAPRAVSPSYLYMGVSTVWLQEGA